MSDNGRTTVSVSTDVRDRLNERKQKDDGLIHGKESVDAVIKRLLNATELLYPDTDGVPEDADLEADIQRLLDDASDAPAGDADTTDAEVRSALDTIESRTGRIEQALEELTEGRR